MSFLSAGHHPDRKSARHVSLFNPSTGFDGLGLSAPVSLRDTLVISRDTRRYARAAMRRWRGVAAGDDINAVSQQLYGYDAVLAFM